jgi:hypothetical protein
MRNFVELENVILVAPETVGQAVSSIVGCEFCRRGTARLPFDCILDRITGRRREMATYLMVECVARCPSCGRGLAEKTLVEMVQRTELSVHNPAAFPEGLAFDARKRTQSAG